MHTISRHTQLSPARAKEKKQLRTYHVPAVAGAHSKNVLGEKSEEASCGFQCCEARAPGRPSTRPELECVARPPSAVRRLAGLSLALRRPHVAPSRLFCTPPMGGCECPLLAPQHGCSSAWTVRAAAPLAPHDASMDALV